MSNTTIIALAAIVLGAFLAFRFVKSAIKILLAVAAAAAVLFFTSKYTGLSILW